MYLATAEQIAVGGMSLTFGVLELMASLAVEGSSLHKGSMLLENRPSTGLPVEAATCSKPPSAQMIKVHLPMI